jgi:hypothetical protein
LAVIGSDRWLEERGVAAGSVVGTSTDTGAFDFCWIADPRAADRALVSGVKSGTSQLEQPSPQSPSPRMRHPSAEDLGDAQASL